MTIRTGRSFRLSALKERASFPSLATKKSSPPIADLQPPRQPTEPSWQLSFLFGDSPERAEAERWMECIRPFLNLTDRTREAIENRAAEYDVHPATVYRRLAAWDREGRLDALLPQKPSGGRGKPRLQPEVEEITNSAIESHFLTKQRLTVKDVAMEVRRACESTGLPPPHRTPSPDASVRCRPRSLLGGG